MGERIKSAKLAVAQAGEECIAVQALGGRMHVRWDDTARPAQPARLAETAQNSQLGNTPSWSPTPHTSWPPSGNSTETAAMVRTVLMSSRANGAGVASPRKACSAARSLLAQLPWPTTGGVGMRVRPDPALPHAHAYPGQAHQHDAGQCSGSIGLFDKNCGAVAFDLEPVFQRLPSPRY